MAVVKVRLVRAQKTRPLRLFALSSHRIIFTALPGVNTEIFAYSALINVTHADTVDPEC